MKTRTHLFARARRGGALALAALALAGAGAGLPAAARAQQPGTVDATFTPPGINGAVYSIYALPGGQFLVGGFFSAPVQRAALLNANGTLVAAFATNNLTFSSGQVNAIAAELDTNGLPDGKVIIGGSFVNINGVTINRLARLNADGTLDTNYNSGLGFNANINSLLPQAGGLMLVGGQFSSYNGTAAVGLLRLDVNGNIDPSFNTGTTFGGKGVTAIVAQPDNRLLTTNSGVVQQVVRLQANGAVDPTFTLAAQGFDGGVTSLVLQPDGNLIVGGSFLNYGVDINHNGGTPVGEIARLTSTGALDTSFATATGSGFNSGVNGLALQANGKVVAVGFFTSFNGTTTGRLARLLPTGALDTGFVTGSGLSSTGNVTLVQPDGQIVVGGTFTAYNGQTSGRLIRLVGDPTPSVVTTTSLPNATVGAAYTATVTATDNPTSFSATGLPAGLSISNAGVISGTPTTAGASAVTVTATNSVGTGPAVTLNLTVNPPAPVITTTSLPNAAVGATYTATVTATGNPTSFSATGLPAGLSISNAGVISGTPTAGGSFPVVVTATNAGGSGQATLTLSVAQQAPVITTTSLPNGTVGTAYNVQVVASNSPTSFSATGLPAGLSISNAGVISGTPTAATAGAPASVVVTATNGGGSSQATLSLTISPTQVPSLATVSLKVTVPIAYRAGKINAVVQVRRLLTDNFNVAVPVNYSLAGTASAGSDYAPLSGQVTIAPGQRSAKIKIQPLKRRGSPNKVTVIITLTPAPDGSYTLGAVTTATLKIRKVPIP